MEKGETPPEKEPTKHAENQPSTPPPPPPPPEPKDKTRRKIIGAGLLLGALAVLGYFGWPSIKRRIKRREEPAKPATKTPSPTSPQPSTAPPGSTPPVSSPPGGGSPTPTSTPSETPAGGVVVHEPVPIPYDMPRPYLGLDVVTAASSVSTESPVRHITVELLCKNLGTGGSTCFLEVFHIAGVGEPRHMPMPARLSDFERISIETLYLPPGSGVTRMLTIDIPEESLGVMFILTDPLLDPCRRVFETNADFEAESRRLVYFGR